MAISKSNQNTLFLDIYANLLKLIILFYGTFIRLLPTRIELPRKITSEGKALTICESLS
jgi:hypothetical protein